jgi:hypothetical protein
MQELLRRGPFKKNLRQKVEARRKDPITVVYEAAELAPSLRAVDEETSEGTH